MKVCVASAPKLGVTLLLNNNAKIWPYLELGLQMFHLSISHPFKTSLIRDHTLTLMQSSLIK